MPAATPEGQGPIDPPLAALEALQAVWALTDQQGCFTQLSDAWCRHLQVAPPAMAGQHWTDWVHPDDLAGDVACGLDQRWRSAAGGWRWHHHIVVPHGEQQLHVIQDIDERKQRELIWCDQATLLESLRLHLPGVFYKLEPGPDGRPRVMFVNEGVRELMEFAPEEVELDFNKVFERIHPDDRAGFVSLINEALKTNQPRDYEYRVVLPQKGVRYIAGRASSAHQSNGTRARFGYQYDVTEHKLYQDAMVQARAAQQASAAKSEFLSRMSHELRTPLNAILGFAQLLKLSRAEPLGHEQLDRVDVIERAGQHLLAVINDVLDLSRIEAGRMPLSPIAVPVVGAFEQAMGLVSGLARDKHVMLLPMGVAVDQPSLLAVRADAVRLQQVLVNLVSNAIKYNRQGGSVRLTAHIVGAEVGLEVADTGVGLSDAQVSHLFEPFNRLGAENTAVEGSGIGLVIVQRLLQLMDGRLEVSSRLGVGTRMTCWLPLASLGNVETPVGHAAPAPLDAPDEAGSAPPQPVSILYVEDNEVNVALVSSVLAMRPQCRLEVARSGAEAIRLAQRARPDLLLLDMHLGDMTGLELASQLDRDVQTEGILRVALSADAMPEAIREAQARGFREYITKPIDVPAFLAVIDRLVEEVDFRRRLS
ncbi:ATP-binding protein [Aquabacterium sp.]|uniref:hybrid sensor histidine kinase/response regulator n=1 Tax=Aquabacterium sp. TaxID=1872578 RepID=UPI0035B266A0